MMFRVKPADPSVRLYEFIAGPLRFKIYSTSPILAVADASARIPTIRGKWIETSENLYIFET